MHFAERTYHAYADLRKRETCQDWMLDRARGRAAGRMARQIWQQVSVAHLPATASLLAKHLCKGAESESQCREQLCITHCLAPQAMLICRWCMVAKKISGRTGQQCAQRWRHKVNRTSSNSTSPCFFCIMLWFSPFDCKCHNDMCLQLTLSSWLSAASGGKHTKDHHPH